MNFLDMQRVASCAVCRGCESDCPAFATIEEFNPTRINQGILAGRGEAWLDSPVIWQCFECHTCSEMCPQNYSWEHIISRLKKEAIRRGKAPKTVQRGGETFLKSGLLGEPRMAQRAKLGLPEPTTPGTGDFHVLLRAINHKIVDEDE
jgi:heterodisulfide reductase subunit C